RPPPGGRGRLHRSRDDGPGRGAHRRTRSDHARWPAEGWLTMVTRKSKAEIEKMRRAGRIVAEVLALVESELRPGVSTGHLDRIAEAHIRAAGAIPSFKGYP